MTRRALALFCILCFSGLADGLAEERPDQIYLDGAALFRKGDYEQASKRFLKILIYFPDSAYAADSVFKIGEGHFRAGKFEEAGSFYRLYLERYSLGRNARDAKMRLAQCEATIGHTIGAARPRIKRPDPPLRAVRVVRFFQASKAALDRDIAQLRTQGANALIVPAFHLQGQPHGFVSASPSAGAYFHSTDIPVCEDVMPLLARLVHKYEMKLIVELPVRSIPGGPRDLDWNPVSEKTNPSKKLDLFSVEGVNTAMSVVADITKVTIDGLLLTDLMMTPLEGYSADGMIAYRETTGIHIDLKEYFQSARETSPGNVKYDLTPGYGKLAQVKSARLLEVAGLLHKTVSQADPNLKVWVEGLAEGVLAPGDGVLQTSQNMDDLAGPPYSGLFLLVDPPRLTYVGALTAEKLSASIDRLVASATIFSKEPSRVFMCIRIEDDTTRKPAPGWQITSALSEGKKNKIRDFAAGPWMPGFDFRKIFSELSELTASEKKEK